jgi:tetratricopeptide (TPR) repeat protein
LMLASVSLVRRFGWATGLITALALVAVASGATLWLADGLRSRLLPASSDAVYDNQKVRGWKDAAALTWAYRWTGVGRGAFEAPATAFRADDEAVRLAYPENLVVQSASEWGVPVTLLLLGLVGTAMVKLIPGLRRRELGVIGAAAGVLAVGVHDLADFGLELLGVAIPVVVALGAVIGRVERRYERHGRQPRRILVRRAITAGLGLWALSIVAAAWAVPRTMDVDFAKVAKAYKEKDPVVTERLRAAIARHPADDHLELIAAEEALRKRDPSALHHLNRALRLHPANWQAHYLAARTLLGLGRRSQAALEYRLAIERGMPPPLDEILQVLKERVVDALPQRPSDLMRFAHALVQRHRPTEADEACQRAVMLAPIPGPLQLERVQVAIEGNDHTALAGSAQAVLDAQPDAEGAALAVRALAQSGDVQATEAALERMLKLHPESSLLTLLGAQLRVDRGDLNGARALLKHTADGGYSLDDRKRAEELLAKIAEKEGDVDAAVMARARARLIDHKLNDITARP